jgi:hypothetical protein
MKNSFINFWKIESLIDYPIIRQGRQKRNYLNETYSSHGYHCKPMTIANVSGWEFLLPQDVTIIWDGINDSSSDHIKIIEGEYYNGKKIVATHTGNGMLTFLSNICIETDKNHFIFLDGPPNYFFEGAMPVKVAIRSDYFNYGENFFCWKITQANKEITFKKGMPFMFLLNFPINLLENTTIQIKDFKSNKELINKNDNYIKMKSTFEKENQNKWSHFYRDGITPSFPEGNNFSLNPKLIDPKNE